MTPTTPPGSGHGGKGVATIETTDSIAWDSLDFPNSYYHAIEMLKFNQCLSKKYTLATPLEVASILYHGCRQILSRGAS